jgi:hypothetical protein
LREYLESLIEKHSAAGLLLDTNLLLLLIIGSRSRSLVGSWKRLNMFSAEDYDTLSAIAERFVGLVTTPNILTEVSNLAENLTGAYKGEYLTSLSDMITILDERYIPSRDVVASPIFNQFGLSDAVIADIVTREFLVLTIDLPLYQYLLAMGVDVLNFNHIRTLTL